jgi:hypothetical protein
MNNAKAQYRTIYRLRFLLITYSLLKSINIIHHINTTIYLSTHYCTDSTLAAPSAAPALME